MEPQALIHTLRHHRNILTILSLCSLSIAVPLYTADIPEEATRVEASIGGYAVLDCHLDFPFGNEIPYHLQWDKDGEWILSWYSGDGEPSVADRYIGRLTRISAGHAGLSHGGLGHDGLGRGSVNVSAIRETDSGLYRCTVSFPNRTPPTRNNGTFHYLEVNGSNLIVSPPVNATVLEGEPAELECQPKTLDSTVRWFKDSRPLEQMEDLVARITIGENGSLVIPKTEITDPGEYSCSVTDKDGLTQTASAVLDVQYKAKVVYAPSELYLPFGKPASLDCHFSANPPLTNLRWEKDGFLFDPYNVPGVFYSRNGSLLFNKVEESHAGSYSCTPYNALGTAGGSRRVKVRVLRAPALRVAPRPLYLHALGGSLTVPCQPDTEGEGGEAPYQIYWTRKDGAPLPPHRWSLSGGNLTITNISASDGGQYVCVIQNEASAVTAATEIRIENLPPRAPQTLTAVPTSRSIKLRWKPGQSHVETEYTIWYRRRLAAEWHTVKLLSLGVTEATVLDLQPSTEYELRVLAQDPIGDGLFSRPIFVTTLEESRSSKNNETVPAAAVTPVTQAAGQMAPLEVSIRLVGSGALVSWGRVGSEGIEPGSAGAPGSGGSGGDESLCVMRAYSGSDQTLAHDKQTHDHYAMIPRVAEGERYWVQVECEAAVGSAFLQVPAYNRLRAVSAGCAVAALLLAALAIALYLARDQLCLPRNN